MTSITPSMSQISRIATGTRRRPRNRRVRVVGRRLACPARRARARAGDSPRPGLSAGDHATLVYGMLTGARVAAGVVRRPRTTATAEPISDRPARPNAVIAAMNMICETFHHP
jgi:hypothetical protein